jgi:hypothetical protein
MPYVAVVKFIPNGVRLSVNRTQQRIKQINVWIIKIYRIQQ